MYRATIIYQHLQQSDDFDGIMDKKYEFNSEENSHFIYDNKNVSIINDAKFIKTHYPKASTISRWTDTESKV